MAGAESTFSSFRCRCPGSFCDWDAGWLLPWQIDGSLPMALRVNLDKEAMFQAAFAAARELS